MLCEAVYQATQNFIAKGEEIANENAEVRNEMVAAVDDVRKTGLYHKMLVFKAVQGQSDYNSKAALLLMRSINKAPCAVAIVFSVLHRPFQLEMTYLMLMDYIFEIPLCLYS